MKAVIIESTGHATVADIPEQSMRPGYIKVQTTYVAMNPTDLDHVSIPTAGRVGGILGCDVAGIVKEIGPGCSADVKVGDAVYGVCHGANLNGPEDGGYAEFAMVWDGHMARIPSDMNPAEAATLGVGITSIGQTLYMTLGLPLPGTAEGKSVETPSTILISGGSSATGTLAIQFAKLSGLAVVATASPKNFDLVKGRGADAVFDYNDPDCGRQINDYTKNSLTVALDCISNEASYKIVAEALSSAKTDVKKPRLVTLLPSDSFPRKDEVEITTTLAYTTIGEAFEKFGMSLPAIPQHWEYGTMFWKISNKLLHEGKFKPHPIELRSGGLYGILRGLEVFAKRSPSGVKYVYKVDETAEAGESVGKGEAVNYRTLGKDW